MKYNILYIPILFYISGCSIRQFYPTAGAMVGGGAGALTGNPAIAGLTAGSGALLGEMAKGNSELQEAKDTINALTHGDVSALVEAGVSAHATKFDSFTSTIKKILIASAVILGFYLLIPIFVARRCSKTEAVRQATRAPFPPKP